jgi:hypothetical protein
MPLANNDSPRRSPMPNDPGGGGGKKKGSTKNMPSSATVGKKVGIGGKLQGSTKRGRLRPS